MCIVRPCPSLHLLFCLLMIFPLVVISSSSVVSDAVDDIFEFAGRQEFPLTVTLRAAILTNVPPFAMKNEVDGTFYGLQPELLESLKAFAAADNIELMVHVDEAPLYSYVQSMNLMAADCNTTQNPQPLEECHQYDMLIGDYYSNPDRFLKVDFTPPWLRTGVSAIKYLDRKGRDFTTLAQAQAAAGQRAKICVVYDSYMDGVTKAKYPNANYYECMDQDDCVRALKQEECVLFADDDLQLRYRAKDDPSLQVTREYFNSQYIVWPLSHQLDPTISLLVKRWMYAAKSNATLDQLFDKYFAANLCPIGFAGPDCREPCDPNHGVSDRAGTCVCESTKWTGSDCSQQVLEDTNLIPPALAAVGYAMAGMNVAAVLICALWLLVKKDAPQVKVAQPLFLYLILLGCLVSSSTIWVLAQEDEGDGPVRACMVIPWLYSIGFSITFGSLFAKIRRVYMLFRNAAAAAASSSSEQRRKALISWQETVCIVGAVLLVDVSILTVWTVVDPLGWERTVLTTDKYGEPLSSEGHCTSDHWVVFASLICALHLFLLGLATYLCYVARNIPTSLQEGKYVAIAMVSNLQIFVVGVPVLIIIGSDPQTSFFVRSVVIWMNDFVVLTLIFGNLMYSVWKRQDEDKSTTREEMRSAVAHFTQAANHNSKSSGLSYSDAEQANHLAVEKAPPAVSSATTFFQQPSRLPSIKEDCSTDFHTGISSLTNSTIESGNVGAHGELFTTAEKEKDSLPSPPLRVLSEIDDEEDNIKNNSKDDETSKQMRRSFDSLPCLPQRVVSEDSAEVESQESRRRRNVEASKQMMKRSFDSLPSLPMRAVSEIDGEGEDEAMETANNDKNKDVDENGPTPTLASWFSEDLLPRDSVY